MLYNLNLHNVICHLYLSKNIFFFKWKERKNRAIAEDSSFSSKIFQSNSQSLILWFNIQVSVMLRHLDKSERKARAHLYLDFKN